MSACARRVWSFTRGKVVPTAPFARSFAPEVAPTPYGFFAAKHRFLDLSKQPALLVSFPRSFTSSSSEDSVDNQEPNTLRRRRRRHNFNLQQIPSFEVFQQQQNIRSLYRQFLRLSYRSSSKEDLTFQIRREFRQVVPSDDPWALKRALSEGGRRYKELSAMLSSVPGGGKHPPKETASNSESSNQEAIAWPWQGGKSGVTSKPMGFPKR